MLIHLKTLRAGGPEYRVEESQDGFSLYVIEGHETAFNALVRRLIDEAGPSFVVFPRSDGKGGYDCAFVIPQTDPD
jgi:hypothetical protein